MTQLQNDLYLRALLRQPTERTPAWVMRQAGRYLPEYLATRAQAGDFLGLLHNPDLACEVTLQPIDRFPLDAAILFSDILTIPDALGLGLYFAKGEGPHFERPINSEADIDKLAIIDPTVELAYVNQTIEKIVAGLDGRVPLIGFSGSPWTLATYMVEGKPSKAFTKIKKMLYREPAVLHKLLNNLAENAANYLNMQIEAGAQAIMLFDTWGGVLGYDEYKEFSLSYMAKIISKLHRNYNGQTIPVTIFTKGADLLKLDDIANAGCDAVGLDWNVDIAQARKLLGDRVALQGNMDPCVLYATPETLDAKVAQIIKAYGLDYDFTEQAYNQGHVFNLGHGIHLDVDPDALAQMLATLRKVSYSPDRLK